MTPLGARWRWTLAIVVLAAWIAGLQVAGLDVALLYLAPAVLLWILILVDRYPGAAFVERLIARAKRPRRRPSPCCAAPRRATHVRLARGGALLAAGLAGRPPPVL